MKTSYAFLFLLALSITGNAQNLDGSWKGNMTGPNGDFELIFTFKVNGDSLTGNVVSEMGTLPIENGKANGNEFSFDVNVNGQIINHTGILDGDIVKLSLPMMDQPMELNREVEKSKIDGKWIGKVNNPQGEMEITFTFLIDGNKLTGKNSSTMGEIELTNGIVDGNDFSFDVDLQGMKIVHKCKYLDDDSIEVKAVFMEQEMPMKLSRVVE
ncbi:MAG: hypothetical protein JW731_15910 [Bacteroidales bacterium]|nr:hypothetical protein [Bacteroidales bacterium]